MVRAVVIVLVVIVAVVAYGVADWVLGGPLVSERAVRICTAHLDDDGSDDGDVSDESQADDVALLPVGYGTADDDDDAIRFGGTSVETRSSREICEDARRDGSLTIRGGIK